jgi:hypothetical protein
MLSAYFTFIVTTGCVSYLRCQYLGLLFFKDICIIFTAVGIVLVAQIGETGGSGGKKRISFLFLSSPMAT